MSLNEENARITLLGCIMTVYVFCGAAIIKILESPNEKRIVHNYWQVYQEFEEQLLNGTARMEHLKTLLYTYGNVTAALGVPGRYERWNFLGSLHFVVTIVTTIGYGSYTPGTSAGKLFVIAYGFVGCAGGILFFNLFLERMITFLAYVLREMYVRKVTTTTVRRTSDGEVKAEQPLDEWKPSIYAVMLCLLAGVVVVALIAVPAYSTLEGWSYAEAAYFCFVSFATIGFGDFVAAQQPRHNNLYVIANLIIVAVGCCFLYSVFNVISIVLKQIVNWLIFRTKKLDVVARLARNTGSRSDRVLRQRSLKMQRGRKYCGRRRKSTIQIIRATLRRKGERSNEEKVRDEDPNGQQNGPNRKLSDDDGLISMKDFFSSNQVSLALMQKQLQESAQQADTYAAAPCSGSAAATRTPIPPTVTATVPIHKASSFPAGKFIPGTIGPLAILCDKLG